MDETIDVTDFEGKLSAFKGAFGRNYRLASEKFKTAIDEIDKSIAHLQKIKDARKRRQKLLKSRSLKDHGLILGDVIGLP